MLSYLQRRQMALGRRMPAEDETLAAGFYGPVSGRHGVSSPQGRPMATADNGILLADPAEYASVAGCMRDAASRTLPAKERYDVASQLPQDLEQLWRSTPA